MGKNVWRKAEEWPLPGTAYRKYFLHSDGGANTSFGSGTLSADVPKDDEKKEDAYSYDPQDPCPNIYDLSITPAEAPYDQRPIERRNDVLVYSTPAFASEIEVSGPVHVVLYAASSARDTDFWAQLTDVFPDGFSMHLTEGIIRGRYRKSLETPELLHRENLRIQDRSLGYEQPLPEGTQDPAGFSSSSFPKYDRNPNTGHAFGKDAVTIVTNQKIYHSKEYPSHVLLPMILEPAKFCCSPNKLEL